MRKSIKYIMTMATISAMAITMTGCFGPETSKEYVNLNDYMMLHYTDDDGNEVTATSADGNEMAAVVCDNKYVNKYAFEKDGDTYMDISGVKKYIDDRFYYDSMENTVMYTNATTIYTSPVGSNEVTGGTNENLDFTSSVMDGETCYVNLKYISKYIDFDYKYAKANGDKPAIVVVNTKSREDKNGTVKKNTQIRADADYMADIVSDVKADTKLTILDKGDEWDKVATDDGVVGYILNKRVKAGKTTKVSYKNDYDTYTHNVLDKKISLAWHQVMYSSSNSGLSDMIKNAKGLNVISPTWFSVSDSKGEVSSIGSADYVKKAHSAGLDVWGLVSDFETDSNGDYYIKTVVNNTKARQKMVSNIMKYASLYDLDGINVDFEYINVSEGAGYLQFLRELSIECRKKGIVLSIDNYQPSAWTEFYDRNQQGRLADYVVVMNYDEHTASSNEAGSVSSLTFTEEGLKNTIDEVGDASRVINGMPFYTRIWTETPEDESDGNGKLIEDAANGNYVLSTKAVSMDAAKEAYTEAGATPIYNEETGQNYVVYEKGSSTYMIWLEDETSVKARLDLMNKYEIAGAGYWKLGLETDDIWNTISQYFK
ncbi:glycosyl hydrolase family 18 protein [Eubacterium sp.]